MEWPSVVLIHMGCQGPFITSPRPPEWLRLCLDQYFLFNDSPVYILTDGENIRHLPKHDIVTPVAIEEYASDKVARFNALYNYPPRNFWTVAATRLIYLENFLRGNSIQHVYHFEYDVLLYFNISDHHSTFRRLYPHIALTPVGPMKTTTGFMYIDNWESLAHLTQFFIEELEQCGIDGVLKKYGVDMVHEMSLMVAYGVEYTDRMGHLPTMPFGKTSAGFEEFGSIFDGAGWGQFVAGNRHGTPPHRAPWAYVGQMLMEHPEYRVDWETVGGLRQPYFAYNDQRVKINNLHIHTKKLRGYMSSRLSI